MQAFNHAVEHGVDIPVWVKNRLYNAFDHFMSDDNKPSLDVLLGCKKRGPHTLKERFKTRGKNLELMEAMDILRRQGIRIQDAAQIAHEYLCSHGDYAPIPEKVVSMYHSEWKKKLREIHIYPLHMIKEVLRSAPNEIQKKYPRIFDQQVLK